MRLRPFACALCALVVGIAPAAFSQQAPAGTPNPIAGLAQRFAPIDLTGTWVSIVTEDWAVRMITPPKGDFESLPLTRAAQDVANRFDIVQAEASGRACEAYGAPALLRIPGRVRIAWQDADTLKIDTDAGEQTRLLHFVAPPAAPAPSRQGLSLAQWQYANGFDPVRAAAATPAADAGRGAPGAPAGRGAGGAAPRGGGGGGGGRGRGPALAPTGGKLKVVTTDLAPGLLRKNGVPYGANAQVTEYFNFLTEPNGTQWLIVTTAIHDPDNLVVDYITSTNFRREPDDSKWRPQPCSLR
jgi:hypothetical protein